MYACEGREPGEGFWIWVLYFFGTGISGVREGDGGDELVIKVPGSAGSVLGSKVWERV